uniref:Ankyrin n=1 Tax=Solibacter usitatus (strain Ellin6076) TaxID=234267 RepID=Q01VM8_SOLUE
MFKLGVLCILPVLTFAAEPTSREWYQAIRDNRLSEIKAMAGSKAAVNVVDSRGTTPLMQAAAVGSLAGMKILLEAGANVNARNGLEITALIYGASNPEKVKMLVAAGADVNAQSKVGRTALIIAAGHPDGTETVRLLISKGADSKAKDGGGSTALIEAARANEIDTVRTLLGQAVEIDAGDRLGLTALLYAASHGNAAAVKLLLDKGANPNTSYDRTNMVRNGPIALTKLTPLMMAPLSSPEAVQLLLDAGGNVNARDGRGMTPLMFAAATDRPNPAILQMLLKAGADRNAESNMHESVGDWAAKFNRPEVMQLVGAKSVAGTAATVMAAAGKKIDVKEAVGRSVALLQSTSAEYFKQSGCIGCHHQPIVGLAVESALKHGIAVDAAARKSQTQVVRGENLSTRDLMLQGVFISVDSLAFFVQHFSEAAYPADEVTDALVSAIASQQKADGSWFGVPVVRPPIEDSTWVRTAMAAAALAKYPIPARRAEFEERVARARRWLTESKPDVAYERSFQLLGLVWTGAGASEVSRAAAEVRRLQREDGGWAQVETLASDAYATAVALYALQRAGMTAQESASRRAVDYLMRTQQADGSWHVRSRAPKLQPYFQSGFPYDHDQWISAAATGWAAAALSDTLAATGQVAEVR